MLDTRHRSAYTPDHDAFRDTVRKVFAKELLPNLDRYEEQGAVDRSFWRACGDAGLLCPTAPMPVSNAQPNKAATSRGRSRSIFTRERRETTAWLANAEQPR